MSLAVNCQLNSQARLFIPTVMSPKLAYHRGKWEGEDESPSKHQICSGGRNMSGATQGETAELTS